MLFVFQGLLFRWWENGRHCLLSWFNLILWQAVEGSGWFNLILWQALSQSQGFLPDSVPVKCCGGLEFSYVLGPCQFSTPSPGVAVFLLSLFPRCNRFSLVHERLRPGEAREASRNPQFQVCASTRLALKKAGSECLFVFWPIGTSLTLSLSWPWP